ncbi:unnamed protein product [Parnassius apollo]|uniref:(apollo) hypothetical protein n=1 Tax=Parnassius apollo TaxID=110799 RepID=A0A8S3X8R0_PARAO|nr:unnamed protein product [Parnassius apollo]
MNVYFVNFMLLAHFELCQSRRYDNFTLYSATPTEQYQLNFLQNLRSEKYIDVIFWKKPSKLFNDVHFMVNPIDSELFQERLDHFRLEAHTLIPNIQSAFDSQKIKKYTSLKIDSFTWDSYHSLEDIYQWISDVALKFPKTVELHSIGKSVEGRDIYAIFIKTSNSKANVVIDAGIHGHEWISTAFVTFLIKKLIYAQDIGDERLNELANKYNWFIIPIVNPDGFDYSIKVDNYGKQAILRMYKLNGVKYSIGTTYDTLGIRVSGSSPSWVKNNYKTKYVITFLLRDNGTYGFALPNEQIIPTCQETLVGLVELMTAKPRRNLPLSYDVNFWRPPGEVNKTIDVAVSPECKLAFIKDAEQSDIYLITIMKDIQRPRVIIEGGIHAREWISPAFVTYMMQQIVHSPSSNNSELKKIAQAYEWYFVPILNPDGYEITHTSDRLWRKNSRGVDLNRNFEIEFGSIGVSSNKLDETYCGENAFSERESSAMASYVRSKSDRLEYYLAFHSYGQCMIIPYAYAKTHMDNFDEVVNTH